MNFLQNKLQSHLEDIRQCADDELFAFANNISDIHPWHCAPAPVFLYLRAIQCSHPTIKISEYPEAWQDTYRKVFTFPLYTQSIDSSQPADVLMRRDENTNDTIQLDKYMSHVLTHEHATCYSTETFDQLCGLLPCLGMSRVLHTCLTQHRRDSSTHRNADKYYFVSWQKNPEEVWEEDIQEALCRLVAIAVPKINKPPATIVVPFASFVYQRHSEKITSWFPQLQKPSVGERVVANETIMEITYDFQKTHEIEHFSNLRPDFFWLRADKQPSEFGYSDSQDIGGGMWKLTRNTRS